MKAPPPTANEPLGAGDMRANPPIYSDPLLTSSFVFDVVCVALALVVVAVAVAVVAVVAVAAVVIRAAVVPGVGDEADADERAMASLSVLGSLDSLLSLLPLLSCFCRCFICCC